jgi:hypothetical protein
LLGFQRIAFYFLRNWYEHYKSNTGSIVRTNSIIFFRLNFEGKRSVSDGLKRFLQRVLEKDPEKRYTIDQMKKDEWVNDGL